MHQNIFHRIVFFSLIFFCTFPATLSHAIDYDDIIRKTEERRIAIAQTMEESTIFVLCVDQDNDEIGFGSGFMVADGYIITSGHVTEGFKDIYVSSNNLNLVKAKRVKEVNNEYQDFTLLKISKASSIPILSFNTSVRRTDRVSSWGYPGVVSQFDTKIDQIVDGEFEGTPPLVYTAGTVSSFVDNGKAKSIVHSAMVASGNSGGPLINARGEVVGINTWRSLDVNEGSMVNAAYTAQTVIDFLRSCNVEPRIIPSVGQFAQAPPLPQAPIESQATANTQKSNNGLRLAGIIQNIESSTSASSKQSTPSMAKHPSNPTKLSSEMQEYYDLAVKGNAEAQAYLGISYYYGDDAPENPDLGVYWLQQAIINGSVDAKAMYGTIQITDPSYLNTTKGLSNLKEAANKDAEYASTLAYFLYNGEMFGIKRDFNQSFSMAKRGAKVNDIDAIALLSFFYLDGIGTRLDNAKALKYANIAAKKEHPLAYSVLSWLYYKGFEVKQNDQKAFDYAAMAAENDDIEGIALLAYFYYHGIEVKEDPIKAFELAMDAAENGNDFGRILLGLFYAEGYGVKKDLALGVAYLDLVIKLGNNDGKELYDKYSKQLNKSQKQQVQKHINNWFEQWGL